MPDDFPVLPDPEHKQSVRGCPLLEGNRGKARVACCTAPSDFSDGSSIPASDCCHSRTPDRPDEGGQSGSGGDGIPGHSRAAGDWNSCTPVPRTSAKSARGGGLLRVMGGFPVVVVGRERKQLRLRRVPHPVRTHSARIGYLQAFATDSGFSACQNRTVPNVPRKKSKKVCKKSPFRSFIGVEGEIFLLNRSSGAESEDPHGVRTAATSSRGCQVDAYLLGRTPVRWVSLSIERKRRQ